MGIENLVAVLNQVREKKFIEGLHYQSIDLFEEEGQKLFQEIVAFDKNRTCFGDDVFDNDEDDYQNIAVYLDGNLIGYVGYVFSGLNQNLKFSLAICLNWPYQGIGLGKVVLKQVINTLYAKYGNNLSLLAFILEDNLASIHLFESCGFQKNGSKGEDFYVFGEPKKLTCFAFTTDDYNKHKKEWGRYRTLTSKKRVD